MPASPSPRLTLRPGCWPPGTAELVRTLAHCANVSQVLVLVRGEYRPASASASVRRAAGT